MTKTRLGLAVLLCASLGAMAACDKSPQPADGATAQGDQGVAPTTETGKAADIGGPTDSGAVTANGVGRDGIGSGDADATSANGGNTGAPASQTGAAPAK